MIETGIDIGRQQQVGRYSFSPFSSQPLIIHPPPPPISLPIHPPGICGSVYAVVALLLSALSLILFLSSSPPASPSPPLLSSFPDAMRFVCVDLVVQHMPFSLSIHLPSSAGTQILQNSHPKTPDQKPAPPSQRELPTESNKSNRRRKDKQEKAEQGEARR